MNKRIEELKEQALIWAVETLDPDQLNDNEWGVAIDKKFAELIVRECLDQCYNRGMNDELYAGQLQAAAYIEEHFGVEE